MSESFAELFEQSLQGRTMQPGSLINAEVLEVKSDVIIVDAGLKSEGVIPIDEFCNKIEAGQKAKSDPDFMIIARMESLIAGWGHEEAISRAKACCDAGADAVMIHSKEKQPDEILEFIRKYKAALGEAAERSWGLSMSGPFWFTEALASRIGELDTLLLLGVLLLLLLFVLQP